MKKYINYLLLFFFVCITLFSQANASPLVVEKSKATLRNKSIPSNKPYKNWNLFLSIEEDEEGEEDETTVKKSNNQIFEEDGLSHQQQVLYFTLQNSYFFPNEGFILKTALLPTPFTPPDFLILKF